MKTTEPTVATPLARRNRIEAASRHPALLGHSRRAYLEAMATGAENRDRLRSHTSLRRNHVGADAHLGTALEEPGRDLLKSRAPTPRTYPRHRRDGIPPELAALDSSGTRLGLRATFLKGGQVRENRGLRRGTLHSKTTSSGAVRSILNAMLLSPDSLPATSVALYVTR
jgi:hypothetical protein